LALSYGLPRRPARGDDGGTLCPCQTVQSPRELRILRIRLGRIICDIRRSPDLFLELIVLTSRTLTAKQVRHGGKQDTDNPELSWIHRGSGAAIALRLFKEARGRPFCWMVCFGVTVIVSIKTSRSAASQC